MKSSLQQNFSITFSTAHLFSSPRSSRHTMMLQQYSGDGILYHRCIGTGLWKNKQSGVSILSI